MTSPEIVLALGRTLKDAADPDRPQDEYRRGQLLSAYSVARHLAAEQSAEAELRSWFRSRMAGLLEPASEQAASLGDGALEARLAETGARIAQAEDRREIGELVCELLAELRAGGAPSHDVHREIQSLLRELCDREVTALADAPS